MNYIDYIFGVMDFLLLLVIIFGVSLIVMSKSKGVSALVPEGYGTPASEEIVYGSGQGGLDSGAGGGSGSPVSKKGNGGIVSAFSLKMDNLGNWGVYLEYSYAPIFYGSAPIFYGSLEKCLDWIRKNYAPPQ